MQKRDTTSLQDFLKRFPDEAACTAYFETIRFRGGEYCAHCGDKNIYRFSNGKRFRCSACKKDFTLKTGTIFGESKISLQKWFVAIYLLTTCKKGISSVELAQKVGVTQKTGWFMDHRIRNAMAQDGSIDFTGTVEADETYVGGKERNKHFDKRVKGTEGRSIKTKVPVFGLLERAKSESTHSKITARVVENTKRPTLEKHIKEHVILGSTLYTDKFLSYANVGVRYAHDSVNHGTGEYVKGDVHTNNIESFWATFKRGYTGTYHHMSKKHMQRYVDEFAHRFNTRIQSFDDLFVGVVKSMATISPLKYKVLTKNYEQTKEGTQTAGLQV